ncbi:MAG TPA: DUF3179 domain-containing protein, partial [Candidatus Handelsmanbacteria bacterium]|nr:DUF3179 domain-containing protein [Candidatus Handelsmanbacteria bacterium]
MLTRRRLLQYLPSLPLLGGCATSLPESVIAGSAKHAPFEMVEGSPMYRMLAPGAIRPVDHPTWADVTRAERFMEEEESVLVVQRGGEVRIYSTWYLEGHEVVNDRIGTEAL